MMYKGHARTICQACNLNLKNSHRRITYRLRPAVTLPQPRPRLKFNALRYQKHFSTATVLKSTPDNGGRNAPQPLRLESEGDSSPQDTRLSSFDQEFGSSLEDITTRRQARIEDATQTTNLGESSDVQLGAAVDLITRVRANGASETQVVREARNIFGDFLPRDMLSHEEMALYRRLYGEPTHENNDGLNQPGGHEHLNVPDTISNTLYSAEGNEIAYQLEGGKLPNDFVGKEGDRALPATLEGDESLAQSDGSGSLVMHDVAESLGGVIFDSELDEFEDDDEEVDGTMRGHPLTRLGKFSTNPKTILLPREEYLRPVEKLMSDFSNKHLKEVCEKTFGGPGLPDSPLTPRSGRFKQQVPIPLEADQHAMSEMEANAFITAIMPPTYASIMAVLVETRKRLGSSWLTTLLSREGGPRVLDASAGGAGIIAWREVVNAHWAAIHSSDRKPPPPPMSKSVVVTGSDTLRHRAAAMLENTTFIPRLPDYVHTRDVPTLEDDRPAQQRKQFDIIIAPHSLFGLKEDWMRKQHVQNLWSLLATEGGILILIEKGMPRGFEAIAGAREMLLERHIAIPSGHETNYSSIGEEGTIHKKEAAMIVAPCTTHDKCPMYAISGSSRGRKDVCSFQQRYIRPGYLQRILGAKDRNHDDVDFSYISVMRGDDLRSRDLREWEDLANPVAAPRHSGLPQLKKSSPAWLENVRIGFETITPDMTGARSGPAAVLHSDENMPTELPALHTLPRIVYPPIKRKGHVSLDLCTPAGKIERWTIPRSFSKQAYRDARKSQWGDLWALGAKTRATRNLRLGTPEKDVQSKNRNGMTNSSKGRSRKERLRMKAEEILEAAQQEKLDEAAEARAMMKELDEDAEVDASIPLDPEVHERDQYGQPSRHRRSGGERKSQSTSLHRTPDTHHDAEMSDIEVSRALGEWEENLDRFDSPQTKKKLNKVEKQKLKKALRGNGKRVFTGSLE